MQTGQNRSGWDALKAVCTGYAAMYGEYSLWRSYVASSLARLMLACSAMSLIPLLSLLEGWMRSLMDVMVQAPRWLSRRPRFSSTTLLEQLEAFNKIDQSPVSVTTSAIPEEKQQTGLAISSRSWGSRAQPNSPRSDRPPTIQQPPSQPDLGSEPDHPFATSPNVLAASLMGAWDRGEMTIHFQPRATLKTNHFSGMEALVRWQSPTLGMVSPSVFIPVAEATGMIEVLDRWVLRQSCVQGQEWLQQGLRLGKLAVNLSARQLQRPGWATTVARTLQETGFPVELLEMEVTETAAIEDWACAREQLKALAAVGVTIALDDFGTGHSSLQYLKLGTINVLKIDRTFIERVTIDPIDRAVTAAIVALAERLGATTIAEGVETAEQRDLLQSMGCDEIQGYWLARPLPVSLATDFLKRVTAQGGYVLMGPEA
ncbi:MAG: EAL domain-containing protein [Oscillatoriales cyanobacterium]|nr:MAG: EAL domain-containing protein [Oscillatoriales cyanobacterium]